MTTEKNEGTKTATQKTPARMVLVSKTVAGNNDRTVFKPEAIAELAASIAAHGLIQPVTVRPTKSGYEIIAGERRFRAIQSLGWTHFPAIVREMGDEEAAAVMLAENTGRSDLDPIDEARAYDRRIKEFGWTPEQAAKKAGVSSARVRSRLKLLRLEETVQRITRTGQFPLGYAQILADADLSEQAQITAMRLFNQQQRPTLEWFREVVVKLMECRQQTMLEEFELVMTLEQAGDGSKPDKKRLPRPAKNPAPVLGVSVRDVLEFQAHHWAEASKAWNSINSPFIAYEADAAVAVLTHLLATLPSSVLNADVVTAPEADVAPAILEFTAPALSGVSSAGAVA